MKLIYLANTRIPTEKAHGWAIMKMCESFALNGVKVELVIPQRKNQKFNGVDAFQHYDIKKNFEIILLSCPDLITMTGRLPRPCALLLGVIQNWLYARVARGYIKKQPDAIIFSREQRLLYFLRGLPNRMAYEVHDFPERRAGWYKKLFTRVEKIVVTNQWKKDELVKRFEINVEQILIAPNAVDAEAFVNPFSKEEARRRLSLPQDKKIVLYAGGFQKWKGVYVLGEALQHLPDDIIVYFVGGGAEPDRGNFIAWLAKNFDQKKYVAHDAVPHEQVPLWLWAADVLVVPGTALDTRAAYYTSPLKLPEYLTSGRPVIMTNLPAAREAVPSIVEGLAFKYVDFIPPDNPHSLAEEIIAYCHGIKKWVLSLSQEFREKHTWQSRAQNIANFLKK